MVPKKEATPLSVMYVPHYFCQVLFHEFPHSCVSSFGIPQNAAPP